jgi:phenylalanyl-tRNA synthetase beta chain
MENPLSDEATLLRPSLLPGMLAMIAHNLNRDVREVRLFEQGTVFCGSTDDVAESASLSLGITGRSQTSSLHEASDAAVFELKGAVESLLSLFTTGEVRFAEASAAWLQPGRGAAALLNGGQVAIFGELSQAQREAHKLRQPVYLAEVDVAALYALPLRKVTARELSRFQAVERDFSFVFPDDTQWGTVASAIKALALPELRRLTPEEIFRDPKGRAVAEGHYALLLRCVFQSNERTLREEELMEWSSAIIRALTELGGAIRSA